MTRLSGYVLAGFGALVIAGASSSRAQSQMEMNQTAAEQAAKADRDLNATYQQLRASLADDAKGRELLDAAERAWIAFRDKEAEYEASPNIGGSIYPLVFSTVTQQLTEERTKYLKELLKTGRE